MDLFFEKSQCASKRSLGHIFNEASKNKNTDPASALRLRKILGGGGNFGHKRGRSIHPHTLKKINHRSNCGNERVENYSPWAMDDTAHSSWSSHFCSAQQRQGSHDFSGSNFSSPDEKMTSLLVIACYIFFSTKL